MVESVVTKKRCGRGGCVDVLSCGRRARGVHPSCEAAKERSTTAGAPFSASARHGLAPCTIPQTTHRLRVDVMSRPLLLFRLSRGAAKKFGGFDWRSGMLRNREGWACTQLRQHALPAGQSISIILQARATRARPVINRTPAPDCSHVSSCVVANARLQREVSFSSTKSVENDLPRSSRAIRRSGERIRVPLYPSAARQTRQVLRKFAMRSINFAAGIAREQVWNAHSAATLRGEPPLLSAGFSRT